MKLRIVLGENAATTHIYDERGREIKNVAGLSLLVNAPFNAAVLEIRVSGYGLQIEGEATIRKFCASCQTEMGQE